MGFSLPFCFPIFDTFAAGSCALVCFRRAPIHSNKPAVPSGERSGAIRKPGGTPVLDRRTNRSNGANPERCVKKTGLRRTRSIDANPERPFRRTGQRRSARRTMARISGGEPDAGTAGRARFLQQPPLSSGRSRPAPEQKHQQKNQGADRQKTGEQNHHAGNSSPKANKPSPG